MHIRVLFSAAVAATFVCLTAPAARAQTASATVCADGTTTTEVGRDLCVGHGGLKAKATSSVETHINCKDGTIAEPGKEPCEHHGGVKSRTSTKRTHTVTKNTGRVEDTISTNAVAICKDGLYSHAELREDACREHGGVLRYLKP